MGRTGNIILKIVLLGAGSLLLSVITHVNMFTYIGLLAMALSIVGLVYIAIHSFVRGRILSIVCTIIVFSLLFPFTIHLFIDIPKAHEVPISQSFVASVNSDKYHTPTCQHAQNILVDNRIYYSLESEAQRDGKTPCSVCLP